MKTPHRTATGVGRSGASEPDTEIKPGTPNSDGREKIPAHWAWHHRTLKHLRDRLLQAHAEHASQVAGPPDTDSNDLADTAQERSTRDLLWAELGAESDKLFEIDCALQRMRDGVYGFCESTGAPISEKRLRAVPWTRYCQAAAAANEVRSQRTK